MKPVRSDGRSSKVHNVQYSIPTSTVSLCRFLYQNGFSMKSSQHSVHSVTDIKQDSFKHPSCTCKGNVSYINWSNHFIRFDQVVITKAWDHRSKTGTHWNKTIHVHWCRLKRKITSHQSVTLWKPQLHNAAINAIPCVGHGTLVVHNTLAQHMHA